VKQTTHEKRMPKRSERVFAEGKQGLFTLNRASL